jgi:hypothetical protein
MMIVEENGHTVAWICWDHGQFPCLCKCGIIQGQEHDILCEKRKAA